jgi:transcriptional regulator with XRE-family HTH domain
MNTPEAPDIKGIPARIREIRLRRGWSQRMLDHKSGSSAGYTTKVENGQIPNPGIVNLQNLCRALQVPISWVLMENESAQSGLPPLIYPELEDITASLAAIHEHDPQRLVALRTIILDVREQAEIKGKGRGPTA